MRLAGQAKLGFYPAAPDAIAGICQHLEMPESTDGIQILDPCCGEGAAIRQIADTLGVPHKQTYAVELDQNRSEAAKAAMPEANILGRCSFLSTRITGHSFSLAYVNPPFDDELGGGRREEDTFVRKATPILAYGSTLVLVVPLRALNGNREFCKYLDAHYEDIRVFKFPDHCRKFNEIVVIGRRRKEELNSEFIHRIGCLHLMDFQWRARCDWFRMLPAIDSGYEAVIREGRVEEYEPARRSKLHKTWKPNTFVKIAYSDDELLEDLERSPLNLLLTQAPPVVLARPPLPPGNGHVSLLVASGMLDGVVEDAEGNTHVVRGTAKKVEYLNNAASSSTEADNGALTTKEVYSQRVILVIRTAWPDGEILTWSDEPEEKPEAADVDSNESLGDYEGPASGLTRLVEELANA